MQVGRRGFLGLGLTAPLWGRAAVADAASKGLSLRGMSGMAFLADPDINDETTTHDEIGAGAKKHQPTELESKLFSLANELGNKAYELTRKSQCHDLDLLSYRSVSPAWQRIQLNIRAKQRAAEADQLHEFSNALHNAGHDPDLVSPLGQLMSQSVLSKLFSTKGGIK
jgi:hypothetical protein